MKEIFIVIVEDRHVDVAVYPFSDKEKAISEARRVAKEYCRHKEDYNEQNIEGCLFFAVFSCEGACVRVVSATLDRGIK